MDHTSSSGANDMGTEFRPFFELQVGPDPASNEWVSIDRVKIYPDLLQGKARGWLLPDLKTEDYHAIVDLLRQIADRIEEEHTTVRRYPADAR
jgi:hypothetical protein